MRKRNGSTRAWRQIRKQILERDNHTCYYCGTYPATTVDHLTPISQGGSDRESNLVSACSNCNYAKQDKSVEQFEKDRRAKRKIKMKSNFFETNGHPPTPAMFFSPKEINTPFLRPESFK